MAYFGTLSQYPAIPCGEEPYPRRNWKRLGEAVTTVSRGCQDMPEHEVGEMAKRKPEEEDKWPCLKNAWRNVGKDKPRMLYVWGFSHGFATHTHRLEGG